jgi:hypothetical protein
MIMRRNSSKYFLFPVILFICIGFLIATPVVSQYSGSTILPINTAVGYGGLFNPYVFWPGIGLNAAASNAPLVPFLPFSNGGFAFQNPLFGLSSTNNGFFNPLLGFGGSFGTNSLSGFNALSGLNSLAGLNSLNPFYIFNPVASALGASILSAPVAPVLTVRSAAQSGTWLGTWQSTYIAFPILWNTGPMFLNIADDPLLGLIVGTAILQDSRYASIPFEVSGVLVNDTITLEGFLGTGYDCVMTCILTSPTTITGFYTVLGTSIPVMDEGIFNLTLNPPVL